MARIDNLPAALFLSVCGFLMLNELSHETKNARKRHELEKEAEIKRQKIKEMKV